MTTKSIALVFALTAACAGRASQARVSLAPVDVATTDRKIAYYEQRTRADPSVQPVLVQLASVQLDKAHTTWQPAPLARARAALDRAMSLSRSYDAALVYASVAAYSHHFEDVLRWADEANRASPVSGHDGRALGLKVEALLGLGRLGEAERVATALPAEDFHGLVGRAQVLKAQGRALDATPLFAKAAGLAANAHAQPQAAWCHVMIAGAHLDAGHPEAAHAPLEAARRLDPTSLELFVHDTERLEAEGQTEQALLRYEALATQRGDPTAAHRAFKLALRLGARARADVAFAQAQRGYQAITDAGEVYALGPLAQLYLDANRDLPLALQLAEENFRWKRDREAVATLSEARRRSPLTTTTNRL